MALLLLLQTSSSTSSSTLTSTLSSTSTSTLPMSCQICLGQVRQPVICPNCHVFCSSCMDTWTQKVSQCPACRVPITPDNPCRRLIAGSSDGEDVQSAETSRILRKTRGVLLLREYEEEIDRLLQENEELKARVQGLGGEKETTEEEVESDLSTRELSPTWSPPDRRASELGELQQLSLKLKSATDVCVKVKEDMERLKQANKLLRSQNMDLVQENMSLRAEVASRSPQKFSRYTVAALEATNQQNEWKLKQLTKALEQSDKTMERLQAQLQGYEGSPPGLWGATGDPGEEKNLVMMRRSLSDTERQSICSNPEEQTMSLEGQSSIFTASSGRSEGEKVMGFTATTFYGTPPKLKASTPSSAFCSLSLKSPAVSEKVAIKAGASLRKLSFEDPPEMVSSTVSQTENRSPNLPKCLAANTKAETSKAAPFWATWQEPKSSKTPPGVGPSIADSPTVGDAASSSATLVKPSGSHNSSEASMDVAYRNKVSELDYMMWDSDSSCSLGSRISPAADLDATLIPKTKPAAAPVVSSSPSKEKHDSNLSLQQAQPSGDPSLNALDTRCKVGAVGERPPGSGDSAMGEPATSLEFGRRDGLWSGKACGVQGGDDSLGPCGGATGLGPRTAGILQGIAAGLGCSWPGEVPVPSVVEGEGLSQTDQLSFDILFDSSFDGPAAGASDSDEPAILPHDSSSSSSTSGWDRQLLSVGQSAKRKSHSPFNVKSPTKLSKFV